MALLPQDGTLGFTVQNVLVFVGSEGKQAVAGGSFVTVSNVPSSQLLPSTNTVLGYWNGQMLARAAGDGTGGFAGLTAGALVNWDVNSTDTGQAVWNGFIICDPSLTVPMDIGSTTTGTILLAIPKANWTIRQQFLYGGGTPSTDATAVRTAVNSFGVVPFQISNASAINASEIVFTY